jgi:N-acetylglucosamine kinase-like BadF-type ATPase
MLVCAGIDGGQSSSEAVVGDESGKILARIEGPPLDLVDEPPGSPRRAERIDEMLTRAKTVARLPVTLTYAAVVAGVSGYDPEAPVATMPRTPGVRLVHDAEVALAGALGGTTVSGIVIIAGTGSVALGRDAAGRRARAGGWGYFFGDEGSAVWIARHAIRAAMQEEDAGRESVVGHAAESVLGQPSLRAIQHAYAHGTIGRPQLADFARRVLELEDYDELARATVRIAAGHLVQLAWIVTQRLSMQNPRISYAGGLFASALRAHVAEHLFEGAAFTEPVYDPAIGALLLAYEIAGARSAAIAEH